MDTAPDTSVRRPSMTPSLFRKMAAAEKVCSYTGLT